MKLKQSFFKTLGLFAILTLGQIPTSAQAGSPSFDCTAAKDDNEKAICKSDRLSKIDRIISADHAALTQKVSQGRADALTKKYHTARKKCYGDENCILKVSEKAMKDLQMAGAPLGDTGEVVGADK